MDDIRLDRVLDGESREVERFVGALEGLALRIARAQYRFSREEAEDVWLNVLEKLWRDDAAALRRWSGRGSLRAYLAVVINS